MSSSGVAAGVFSRGLALDLARAEQDGRPPLYWLPHDYPLIYAARRERDQRPHRARSLPFLAGYYLFARRATSHIV